MKTSAGPGMEPPAALPFLPRAALVARLLDHAAPLVVLSAPEGSGKSMALLALARAEASRGNACHWCNGATLADAPRNGTLLMDCALQHRELADLMPEIRARTARQRIIIAPSGPLPQPLRDEWIAGRAALVTARDLAFSAEEAAALFDTAQPSREVGLLHQFTAGWPLGLGLLSRDADEALALMRRDGARQPLPRSLTLWFDDWLARTQGEAAQQLLMDLAVFERFPATLPQELPARDGAEAAGGMALLAPILDQELFLHDCEGRPGWFRLMPMIARYLRDRLTRHHPERAAEIRHFAVEWNARNRDASEELRHGLAVWTPAEAMARVDAAGAIAVSLAAGPDLELAQPISATTALTAPLTFFGMIYERIRLGAFDEARIHHDNAFALTEGFTRFDTPQDPAQIRGWILLFSAVVMASKDAPVDPAWRAEFGAALRDAISRDPVLAMAQSTVAMLMALNAGAREEVLSIGRLALQLQERTRADKAAIFVYLHSASALIAAARLEEAQAAIQAGTRLAADHTYADSYEMISCQIHAGLCAFESGDSAAARALLEPCHAHFPRIHGWRRNWLDYFAAMADIAFQAKGSGAAEVWITRGLDLAQMRDQPQLALGLELCRIDLALRDGQMAGIPERFADLSRRLVAVDRLAPQIGHLALILEVELLLAAGSTEEAATRFAAIDRAGVAAADLRLDLQMTSLALELASAAGDGVAVQAGLAHAAVLAQGLPRLARLAGVQRRMRQASDWLTAQGIEPGREVRAVLSSLGPRGRSLLSPRESQIIGLIAEGLSTKEIARHLGTSEGTVKSHRKNLHEKLGVSSRSKAIARARELGLLQGS